MNVININGYDWNVEFVPKSDERLENKSDGRTLYNDFTIIVRDDLNIVMKEEVLIHELTHAFLCVQGRVYQKKFDLEELCEFVGFVAKRIVKIADEVIKDEIQQR